MPKRRYRYTWDDIAWLDCDYMASWGALVSGRQETIDFDDDDLPKLAFEMDDAEDKFSVFYQLPDTPEWLAMPVRSTVHLDRRPCRFGGTRAYFICPSCGRRTLRLAVLVAGLLCGTCGSVTWKSRREHELHRLMRKADKLSVKLGVDSWRDPIKTRPPHMRQTTFERLIDERQQVCTELLNRIHKRMARGRGGLFDAMVKAVKIGL